MKYDLTEPIEILKETQKYRDNALILATGVREENDDEFQYTAYVDGKNRPCREAILYILSEFIDTEKGNLDGQLALIKFFKVMLSLKKKEVIEEAKKKKE